MPVLMFGGDPGKHANIDAMTPNRPIHTSDVNGSRHSASSIFGATASTAPTIKTYTANTLALKAARDISED